MAPLELPHLFNTHTLLVIPSCSQYFQELELQSCLGLGNRALCLVCAGGIPLLLKALAQGTEASFMAFRVIHCLLSQPQIPCEQLQRTVHFIIRMQGVRCLSNVLCPADWDPQKLHWGKQRNI